MQTQVRAGPLGVSVARGTWRALGTVGLLVPCVTPPLHTMTEFHPCGEDSRTHSVPLPLCDSSACHACPCSLPSYTGRLDLGAVWGPDLVLGSCRRTCPINPFSSWGCCSSVPRPSGLCPLRALPGPANVPPPPAIRSWLWSTLAWGKRVTPQQVCRGSLGSEFCRLALCT